MKGNAQNDSHKLITHHQYLPVKYTDKEYNKRPYFIDVLRIPMKGVCYSDRCSREQCIFDYFLVYPKTLELNYKLLSNQQTVQTK